MPKTGTRLMPAKSPVVLALTIEETCAALRMCRTRVYDAIRVGDLVSYRVGRSRRVTVASIEEYQRRLVEKERQQRMGA